MELFKICKLMSRRLDPTHTMVECLKSGASAHPTHSVAGATTAVPGVLWVTFAPGFHALPLWSANVALIRWCAIARATLVAIGTGFCSCSTIRCWLPNGSRVGIIWPIGGCCLLWCLIVDVAVAVTFTWWASPTISICLLLDLHRISSARDD